MFCHRFGVWIGIVMVGSASVLSAEEAVTFEKDVKPILKKHCLICHNPDRPRGELDLSTFATLQQGGASGKVVSSKKPEESPMYTMAAHLEEPKMPPNSPKIPQREIDVLKKWIEGGLIEKATATVETKSVPKSVPTAVVQGLQPVKPLTRNTAISALAVSPNRSIAVFPGQNQVLVYDLSTNKLLGGLAFPQGEIHALRFSQDGKLLLVGGGIGGQSGQVIGFNVENWNRVFTIGDETDVVLSCDITSDHRWVALGGPTRVVKIYSVADGKLLHAFRKPTDWVTAVRFSPEGLLLAAGDRFGSLFVWETQSGKEFAILRGHTKSITAMSWRADSDVLASSSEDGTIRLWNLHTLSETNKWLAHAQGALDVQFHSSGKIISCGRDARIQVCQQDSQRIADLGPAADHIQRIAMTNDGQQILSGDWSGNLQIWSLQGQAPQTIQRPLAQKSSSQVVVLPEAPKALVTNKPNLVVKPTTDPEAALQLAKQDAEQALNDLKRAEAELTKAKRSVALQAAKAGLAQLRWAAAAEPNNPTLTKAIAEAEAAVKSLSEAAESSKR